jgi:hypothetical protein
MRIMPLVVFLANLPEAEVCIITFLAVLLRFMVGGSPRYTAPQELNGPVPFAYDGRVGWPSLFD